MAIKDIILQINDFTNVKTSSYQVSDISNDMRIRDIIDIIKRKRNYTNETESLILYFARVECLHDEKLSTYNKSNRKNIKLELYVSNMITVRVQTLQSCGSGTTRCIPLWALCFSQTIKVKIMDTCEVRALKQKIYDMTEESCQISPEHMVLLYKKAPLNNFLTLKESEIVDGSKLKMFVPLCHIHKDKKEETEPKKSEEDSKDNA